MTEGDGTVTRDFSTITIEDWLRGPLHVAGTEAAHANKRMLDAHLQAEWTSDLDGTMATMHRDEPWQIVHGLGVEVRGFDAVTEYYATRFTTWTGPGMEYFTRVTIADTCAYMECSELTWIPDTPTGGRHLSVPTVLVVDFRDGLVLGETVYMDSALLRGQLGGVGA
jgi:hypothetical protein